MSEERPPLRIVISDPRAGDKVVRVRVKGVEDESLPYSDDMVKTKERERLRLPPAKVSRRLFEELGLGEVGVMTLRFTTGEGRRVKAPFKVIVAEGVGDREVQVNMGLMGELVGELEAEAEAFRAKSWQIAVGDEVAQSLAGLNIGDVIDGSMVGMPGLKLKIRGGTDATGIPLHSGVPGSRRVRALLSGPPGFKPLERGERRRKSVRGRVIPDPRAERRKTALAQLNLVLVY